MNDPAQQAAVWRADRIGFHRYVFSRFHTGSTNPDPSAIVELLRALGLSFPGMTNAARVAIYLVNIH